MTDTKQPVVQSTHKGRQKGTGPYIIMDLSPFLSPSRRLPGEELSHQREFFPLILRDFHRDERDCEPGSPRSTNEGSPLDVDPNNVASERFHFDHAIRFPNLRLLPVIVWFSERDDTPVFQVKLLCRPGGDAHRMAERLVFDQADIVKSDDADDTEQAQSHNGR